MPFEIATMPAMRLIGLPHRGPYPTIGKTWERFAPIAGRNGLFGPGAMMVSLYFDHPCEVAPEELRSAACVTCSERTRVAEGLEEYRVRESECATMTHVGPYSELGAAWVALTKEVGERADLSPGWPRFEIYRNDPRSTPESELRTDLYVPVGEPLVL